MIAIVFGIQGVGKSAILDGVQQKADIERIYWGGITEEVVTKENLVTDIDLIRKLDVPTQKRIQAQVAEIVKQKIAVSTKQDIVIETHAALKTPQGFMPCLNQKIIDEIKPDVLIIIEANAENIFTRRMNDKTRVRDHDKSMAEITANLNATRWFASTYTIMSEGTLYILENKEGDLDFAINKTVEILNLG